MQRMIDDIYNTMPWNEIDTVIFDVGQVLLSFEPGNILEQEYPGQKELHDKLMVRMFKSPYWIMMDHGTITNEEAIDAMVGRDESLRPAIKHILHHWIDFKHVITEGVEAVKVCKAHGKKLYVLSNYNGKSFDYACKQYDFFLLFDDKIVSSRVHLVKPDPAIYKYVTEKYELMPSRTLFIDDSPANIEAALHAGWQGFCMNKAGKLHEFICG